MRRAAVLVALCLGVAPARAQVCSGGVAPQLDFQPIVETAAGVLVTVDEIAAITLPDCQCGAGDLYEAVQVVTPVPVPQGVSFFYEVWLGTDCASAAARVNNSPTCVQLNATIPAVDFVAGATTGMPVEIVPAATLVSVMNGQCQGVSAMPSVWLLFGDPDMPDYCEYPLAIATVPPGAPSGVVAHEEPAAVSIEWTAPPPGESPAARYQLLCADEAGNPLGDRGATALGDAPGAYVLGYDTCLRGGALERRSAGVRLADLPDFGLVIAAPDGGAPAPDGTPGVGPFTNLDKRFVCSAPLDAEITALRITDLDPAHIYSFAVVAIDAYGNPSPSAVVTARPLPPDDAGDGAMSVLGGGGCGCHLARRGSGGGLATLILLAVATWRRRTSKGP